MHQRDPRHPNCASNSVVVIYAAQSGPLTRATLFCTDPKVQQLLPLSLPDQQSNNPSCMCLAPKLLAKVWELLEGDAEDMEKRNRLAAGEIHMDSRCRLDPELKESSL